MKSSDTVELYRRWQEALARYGVTDLAMDLLLELLRHIEADPCLNSPAFESELEELHVAAWPDARRRPPRLTAGELVSIIED